MLLPRPNNLAYLLILLLLIISTKQSGSIKTYSVNVIAGQSGVTGNINSLGTYSTFNGLYGIAVDKRTSNIYIADSGNHVIRLVNTIGVSSTFAGVMGSPGGDDGFGTSAKFNWPAAVVVNNYDSNLYVADRVCRAIRKISLSTSAVSVFSGDIGSPGMVDGSASDARFSEIYGIAAHSSDGTIFVSDIAYHNIR